jgi:hypothetical protein
VTKRVPGKPGYSTLQMLCHVLLRGCLELVWSWSRPLDLLPFLDIVFSIAGYGLQEYSLGHVGDLG